MVAVPTDPDAPAVILAENILSNDSGDTMQVPFQAWQRRPADAAMLAPTTVPN